MQSQLNFVNSQSITTIQKCIINKIDKYRHCIEILREARGKVFACGVCRFRIALSEEVFTVPGADGIAGAYVNPHG